jgi:L-lactate dehydrogenase complex protein LldF
MNIVEQAENAAEFINDRTHEQHLDQLLWMLRTRRDEAASRVPEWEQLRDLASQIKEHTLSHLAHYLEMFESRAKANGVTVHWAQDAHEHNQIVYQLLSDRKVDELIKSKSMLTEECDTRRFLEERGIRVTETDLGERIQQLDDQPPSHIVGPAWHKTTQDIANVFAKAYGSDKEKADPVYLAHVMRENTRPLIKRARAGMTGANFAVAETGAIVTVTNEGNADLSGNVPELRICSVGLEKIIPRNEDLAVFIRLLTRSATGNSITQYTSHFRTPRQNGEMHIILVDNGRSSRLGMEKFWPSLKCIRCAACMNTCPVYRRSGGLSYGSTYMGPIGIIMMPTFDIRRYSELPFCRQASPSIISTWRASPHRSSPLSRTSSRRPSSASAPWANCSRERSSRRWRAPTRNQSSLPFPTRSRNMNVCPRTLTPGRGARWSTLAVCNSRRFTSARGRSCLHRPTTSISSPPLEWPFTPRTRSA